MKFYYKNENYLKMMFSGFKAWSQFLIIGLRYSPDDINFKKSISGYLKEGYLRPGVWINSIPEDFKPKDIITSIYIYTEVTQTNQYLFRTWKPNFIRIQINYDGFIPQSDDMKELEEEYTNYANKNKTIAELDYSSKLELKNIWTTFQDWIKFLIIGLNYDILDTIPILQEGTYGEDQSMNNFANLEWNNIKPNELIIHLARYALYFPEKHDIIRNTMENFNYMKQYLDINYIDQYDWIIKNVQINPIDPLIKELISIGSFESYYLKIRSIIRKHDTSHLISRESIEKHDSKLLKYYDANITKQKN